MVTHLLSFDSSDSSDLSSYLSSLICFSFWSSSGVIATDLDFDIEFDKIVPGVPDDVTFDIDLSTLYTSAGADGNNLWRVGFFTSPDEIGSVKSNYDPQILTRSSSSTDLEPGEALKLDNVNTQVDLTGLGCEEDMKFVCLEFAKGQRANPDFKFEVSGGGDVLVKCIEQECEKRKWKYRKFDLPLKFWVTLFF